MRSTCCLTRFADAYRAALTNGALVRRIIWKRQSTNVLRRLDQIAAEPIECKVAAGRCRRGRFGMGSHVSTSPLIRSERSAKLSAKGRNGSVLLNEIVVAAASGRA